MKKYLLIFLLLILLITSCKKNNNEEITKLTVTYNTNPPKVIMVDYNTELILDVLDNKDGYIFMGWVDNSDPTISSINPIKQIIVTKDLNLDPVFVKDSEYRSILIDEAISSINIPAETITDLELPTNYKGVNISWKTNYATAISTTGKVARDEFDVNVRLTATFKYDGLIRSKSFNVLVPKIADIDILNNVLNNYQFEYDMKNGKYNFRKDFSTDYTNILTVWRSSEPSYVSDDGAILQYPETKMNIKFTLTLLLNDKQITKEFYIEHNPMTFSNLVELALSQVVIENYVHTNKIYLPTEFDYGIKGVWNSTNPTIITSDGKVTVTKYLEKVQMKLTLSKGDESMEKDYIFKIQNKEGLIVENPLTMNKDNMTNLKISDRYLVLNDDAVSGEYVSDEIATSEFLSLVPTWDALTSTTATVQFMVRVCVNGTWSNYVKYSDSGWGLGLSNKCYDQDAGVAKLVEDEFKIKSGTATKVQYKLIFNRTNLDVDSPKLFLVTLALELKNAPENIASTYYNLLPSSVNYNVPKLYQRAVPSIGGVICSATSSTMLLKYKGMSFVDKDPQYEHRYIASLVKECNTNVYGNWCFNCVTMGAFGFYSYVERMFSIEELVFHLAEYGPVAISVKGQMTSNIFDYYTAGHLLVIKGYIRNDKGEITFIANDPNVQQVECQYSEQIIKQVWRNVIYTIE